MEMDLIESISNSSFTSNSSNDSVREFVESEFYEKNFEEIYRHNLPVTIILILAYLIILIVGLIGNALVVYVILRKLRKTVTNLFILNLSIADFLVIVFCILPNLFSNIYISWTLGYFLCVTVPFVQGVSVCSSIYTLVAISLDRFIAIWFPLGGGLTKRKARLIILLIWTVSCSLSLPWLIYFDLVVPNPDEDPDTKYCIEVWPYREMGDWFFIIGNMVFLFIFPLCGISIFYLLIYLRVVRRNIPTENYSAVETVHRKAKMGVLRMICIVVIIFFVSWLPLYIIFGRIKLGGELSEWEDNFLAIATPLAQVLGSAHSCINPIIYTCLNVKFRKAFLSLLPSCLKSPSHSSQTNVQKIKSSNNQRQTTTYQTSLSYNLTATGF